MKSVLRRRSTYRFRSAIVSGNNRPSFPASAFAPIDINSPIEDDCRSLAEKRGLGDNTRKAGTGKGMGVLII